jgi:hypothetical protein
LAAGLALALGGCVSSNSPTGQKDVSITGPINSEGATPSSSSSESTTSTRSATLQPSGSESGGTSGEETGGAPGAATQTGEGASGAKVLDIRVTGTRVTPAPSRVEVSAGEPIRVTVTSDVDNELHIHGVNVERTLSAGRPVTVEFVARNAGTYEVELHDPALLLFKYNVR